jgi:hypothetical protein
VRKSMKYFLVFLVILLCVFRDLLLGLGKNLISWLDYPYVIWVIYQNLDKIKTLNFVNYFQTNAFYPSKLSLLFSDLLIPQTILAYPFSLVFDNPILVFNLVFLFTFVLNYISLFLFWKVVFKKDWLAFIGSVLFIFSPFFFLQLGHVQMLSYWPFFFGLYSLLMSTKKRSINFSVLTGLFIFIQFLSSVYLSLFMLYSIVVYKTLSFLRTRNWVDFIVKTVLILSIFGMFSGYFIYKYAEVKNNYELDRNIGEYILYSAHLSDYIFTTNLATILNKTSFVSSWNKFDHHVVGEKAAFPGLLMSIMAFFGLFKLVKNNKEFGLVIETCRYNIYFVILLVSGLVFSLGPRLNFNGSYAHIPLPYYFFIKYLPFFDSIRALARWSFVFYLGIVYFVLRFMSRLQTKPLAKKVLLVSLLVGLVFECFPNNIKSVEGSVGLTGQSELYNLCLSDNLVVLEVPYTHMFGVKGGIVGGLSYISKIQLSSLGHNCNMVNGYSGFNPKDQLEYFDSLSGLNFDDAYIEYCGLLKTKDVNILRVNEEYMSVDEIQRYDVLVEKLLLNGCLTGYGGGVFRVN